MTAFITPPRLFTLFLPLCLASCMPGEEKEELGPVEARGILYRGQVYTPDEIQKSGLQIDHFAASPELDEQGLLAGFDSQEESSAYLYRVSPQVAGPTLSCNNYAFFYKYSDFIEDPNFHMTTGEARLHVGSYWNDNIASVRTPGCLSTTILYKHSNFGGATLSLGPNSSVNLKDYNVGFGDSWRDDASSIRVVANTDFSATNTSSATQYTTNVIVNMSAGQTIEVGTCSVPSTFGNGDTVLRLFDISTGEQVAYNDDACGYLSAFSFTATTNGPFEIRAGCWSSGSCNGRLGYTVRW